MSDSRGADTIATVLLFLVEGEFDGKKKPGKKTKKLAATIWDEAFLPIDAGWYDLGIDEVLESLDLIGDCKCGDVWVRGIEGWKKKKCERCSDG